METVRTVRINLILLQNRYFERKWPRTYKKQNLTFRSWFHDSVLGHYSKLGKNGKLPAVKCPVFKVLIGKYGCIVYVDAIFNGFSFSAAWTTEKFDGDKFLSQMLLTMKKRRASRLRNLKDDSQEPMAKAVRLKEER